MLSHKSSNFPEAFEEHLGQGFFNASVWFSRRTIWVKRNNVFPGDSRKSIARAAWLSLPAACWRSCWPFKGLSFGGCLLFVVVLVLVVAKCIPETADDLRGRFSRWSWDLWLWDLLWWEWHYSSPASHPGRSCVSLQTLGWKTAVSMGGVR